MRQAHVAGEKLFVDYDGTTIDIVDATTGEVHACQQFVAALGASSFTYAKATFTQTLPDWIGSHTRAFGFYGGVPAMVVSDNLKSGVTKACFYEPGVNRAYAEMAVHYDTAIVPARPRKPRDKAKVEVAVQVTTRWIIAKLRNIRFFSLVELNAAIRDCVIALNDRVSRHLGASRRALFEALDQPALKPLPTEPYVYAEWKQCKAGATRAAKPACAITSRSVIRKERSRKLRLRTNDHSTFNWCERWTCSADCNCLLTPSTRVSNARQCWFFKGPVYHGS